MAYDHAPETLNDSADADALKARREALRAFVSEIADIAQTLQLSETYLEAERATRCLTVADRAVQVLGALTVAEAESPLISGEGDHEVVVGFTDTKRLRLNLRAYADRVMEAVTFIPKPDTFLEVERAQRYALSAERLLTQLYVAPKAKIRAPFPDVDEAYDSDIPEDLRGYNDVQLEDLRANMPDRRLPVTHEDWVTLLERKIARYRPKPQPDTALTNKDCDPPLNLEEAASLTFPNCGEGDREVVAGSDRPISVFSSLDWRNHCHKPCHCSLSKPHCAPGACPHALSP